MSEVATCGKGSKEAAQCAIATVNPRLGPRNSVLHSPLRSHSPSLMLQNLDARLAVRCFSNLSTNGRSEGNRGELSLKEKFQQMAKDYGKVIIVSHVRVFV